jgi:hypothetical protein
MTSRAGDRKEVDMIAGISAQLPERWKLKIGGKGEERPKKGGGTYRIPQKWPYMQICRNERDEDGNFIVDKKLTEQLGSEEYEHRTKDGKSLLGKGPRVIGPVMLPYNDADLNLFVAYRCYKGRTCVCRGNGISSKRLNDKGEWYEADCPCKNLTGKSPTCKPNGIFSFLFPDAPLQGVCKFRTTSYHSIKAIMGGMGLVSTLTRGRLIGIPFYLRLNETEAQVSGKVQTIYYVSLECKDTMAGVKDRVLEYTKNEAQHLIQMEQAETEARKLLAIDADVIEGDDGDPDVDEFYPEYEELEDGSVVEKQTGELVEAPPVEKKEPTFPLKQQKAPEPEKEPEPEPEPEEEEAEPVAVDIGEGGLI